MSDEPSTAEVLAKLAASSRARQNDPRVTELRPANLFARIRECEQLADSTIYPEMAAIMRKLIRLMREVASSPPAANSARTAANDR